MVNLLLLLNEIPYANLRSNIIIIIDFQLKANNEFDRYYVNPCYGVTKDPNEDDYLLVFDFEKYSWKYKIDEFIIKLQNTLNKLINENDLSIKTTELLLNETLKIIENCTSCKDKKIDGKKLDECLAELEKEEQREKKGYIIHKLKNELKKIDFKLNEKILCKGCKEKKIEKLTDKYGNKEIVRFLCYDEEYIRWIPFDEFKNIEYLAKGGFGEVHKATWIARGYYGYYDKNVVLKKIYNNSSDDKIVDILKEVK